MLIKVSQVRIIGMKKRLPLVLLDLKNVPLGDKWMV